jgi:hypothetical protein
MICFFCKTRIKIPCSGIGLLGAFSSVDWAVRKGAADTLLALNRMLGPLLEHAAQPDRARVPRCIEAIKDAKHDRVRPVRDSMSAALAAFQELQDWMIVHPVCTLLVHFVPYTCVTTICCLCTHVLVASLQFTTHSPNHLLIERASSILQKEAPEVAITSET